MRRVLRMTAAAVSLLAMIAVTALPAAAVPEGPADGTPEWYQREAANYARTREEANRQFTSPAFQQRLTEQSATNLADYTAFQAANRFLNQGNLCSHWMDSCAGDPFLYPGASPFFEETGGFTEVLFFDRECARISGRVWTPLTATAGDDLPGIVITNGSVQAPETLYWWAAHALVEAGYTVMTWDPRGQGRSDTQTPDGTQGSNANPTVFWDGTVDAIDFFRSTPDRPYPHNETCAASVDPSYALPNATTNNPHHDVLDLDRLGLAGHSLGATGVSRVQGMDPWEGRLDTSNPVDVIVGWDSLSSADPVVARVPAMGQSSEYGLFNVPFDSSPDPDGHTGAFDAWAEAGLPVAQFTIRGSTHYEWSLIPSRPVANFSSTSWVDWGLPMARHHTVAWFDRWLKHADEAGYETADARLLDDAQFCDRFSFYFRSARSFPSRDGAVQVEDDIRDACLTADAAPVPTPAPTPQPEPASQPAPEPAALPTTGGGLAALALAGALVAGRRRRT